MGFLDGLLSPLLTSTSQAVAGEQQGDIQGFLEKRKLNQAEAAASLKAALEGAQTRNLNSEIFSREHPKPTYDSDRGVTVDLNSGTATPVAGVEPKDKVGEAVAIAKATKGIPTYGDLHPHEQNTYVTGTDPSSGQPEIYAGSAHGSPSLTPMHVGKPAPGGTGQGTSQMAAAKANMESAMKVMDEYEGKLRKDPSLFGVLDASQGALASSPTAITAQHVWDVPVSLGANMSASHLQNSNPELARYLTAKKFIAEAILNTHKRPNQTQYEIEQELGGVGPNPSPMQIDMVASRRSRMFQEVFGGQQTPPPSQAPGHTGASDPGGDINLGKPSNADPTAGMSDADAWEYHVSHGMTKQQATAAVRARHGH